MLKQLYLLLILLNVFAAGAIAQPDLSSQPLQAGDTMPDIRIRNIVNFSVPEVNFSSFKGKIVILDFWSTWCSTCIELFPKMQSLQEKFGDKIIVLPVNAYQDMHTVDSILAKRKKIEMAGAKPLKIPGNGINLPSVMAAKNLLDHFPHSTEPHEIIIDGNGIVRAITDFHSVTTENIQRLLNGQKIIISAKGEDKDFDRSLPYLVNGNGGPPDNFLYRSIISRYNNSLRTVSEVEDSNALYVRLFNPNQTIARLYNIFFRRWLTENNSLTAGIPQRIIWETAGKDLYDQYDRKGDYNEWNLAHRYCYEIILPNSFSIKSAYEHMRQQLDIFFGLKSSVEIRPVRCWVLYQLKGPDKIKALDVKGGSVYGSKGTGIYLQNLTVPSLVADFANILRDGPVIIDKTFYTGHIDIALELSLPFTLSNVNRQLATYNLIFKEELRSMEVLIIKG